MKYTDRELRLFNLFGLVVLTLGGVFLAFGLIEFAIMPEVEYYHVVKEPAVYKVAGVDPSSSEESAAAADNAEAPPTGAEGEGVAAQPPKPARPKYVYDISRISDVNLGALSRTLLGVVFVILSLLLNQVLRHVVKHGGEDVWKQHIGFSRRTKKESKK